jgi:hypothetical protein
MQNAIRPWSADWRWRTLMGCALVPVAFTGCQNMSNTDKGALAGGAIGAGTGALLAGRRNSLPGALIGGAVGAITGSAVGSSVDNSQRKAAQAAAAAEVVRRAPTLQDIVALTASGSSDAVIIDQIRSTGAVYPLTTADIRYLQDNGVREPVIRELQATSFRTPRVVYTAVPQPVYVAPPPPPPPVGFGVVIGGR